MCTTTQCIPDGEVGTEPRHLAGNFSNLQSQLVSGGETEHLVNLPKIKFAFLVPWYLSTKDFDFFASTWGCLRSVLTLESMARTKAAVLPVPDWDWAIMFCGGSANKVGKAVS